MLYAEKSRLRVKLISVISLLIILLFASACSAYVGTYVVYEEFGGNGATIKFTELNAQRKFEMTLKKGDEIQFEVLRKEGEISIRLIGKNGSEPYSGRDIESGIFTVTVHETDTYFVLVKGREASGKIKIKNLGS